MRIPFVLKKYEYGADSLSNEELVKTIKKIYWRFSDTAVKNEALSDTEELLDLLILSGAWKKFEFHLVEQFQEFVKELIIRKIDAEHEDNPIKKITYKWRLPTKNELHAVGELGLIDEFGFENDVYWTSTECEENSEGVYVVNFSIGIETVVSKERGLFKYRLCTGELGQPSWSFANRSLTPKVSYNDVMKLIDEINKED